MCKCCEMFTNDLGKETCQKSGALTAKTFNDWKFS